MTRKTKGRDKMTSIQAKQAILTACTYSELGTTVDKIEFDTMTIDNKYNHIVFTDCENIPDMKAVTGTMLISEVHGNRDTSNPKIISARLPCACPPCRNNIMDAQETCKYRNIRSIKEQLIIQNRSSNVATEDDPLGLNSLTVAQLKPNYHREG